MTSPMDTSDFDVDPALAAAVREIESHIAEGGWDQTARLYALVETAQLVEHEPALAAMMGNAAISVAAVGVRPSASMLWSVDAIVEPC